MCGMSVTRMRAAAVRRPSLPLTEDDERDLASLRTSPLQRAVLERLSGEPVAAAEMSESALLHAVFEAGLGAVRAASEEAGYAQLALEMADEAKGHRSAARRRRPSWAHEE